MRAAMIATHIFGGMGNQLFQVAAGKALAARLGVELVVDTRYFDRPRPVGLRLQHFNVQAAEVARTGLPAMRHEGLARYLAARIRGTHWHMFAERGLPYDPAFAELGDGSYLKGYWQSERYFGDFGNLMREHLAIVTPPDAETVRVMQMQDRCFAVSLHVRRGDYVSNPKFLATHGICSLDYYRKAADRIAESSTVAPTFFAFSDEPDWVRDNLDLPYDMVIVSHNRVERNYEDIRLMARCRHHIVANSSFSWWGAWWNPDPDKMVIAPSRWFADPAKDDSDLVPQSWLRM